MKIVKPEDFCTVVLGEDHFPAMDINARAVFYHLLKGHGYGLDANKRPYRFEDMQTKTLAAYPDNPILRSAPNINTGEPTIWLLPTIFVPTSRFYYPKKKLKKGDSDDNLPSLREVYEHYKHRCVRCHKIIKNIKDASRDHHVPRALGGGNEQVNVTLMCKRCNSELGHSFPKYDIDNVEIMPTLKLPLNCWMPPYDAHIWPGWADVAPWLASRAEAQKGLVPVLA
jgi:hypothetical protein